MIWCSTVSSTRWRLCIVFSFFKKDIFSMFDSELVDCFLQKERHPPQNQSAQDEDLRSEVKSFIHSFRDPLFDSHITKIKLSLESLINSSGRTAQCFHEPDVIYPAVSFFILYLKKRERVSLQIVSHVFRCEQGVFIFQFNFIQNLLFVLWW